MNNLGDWVSAENKVQFAREHMMELYQLYYRVVDVVDCISINKGCGFGGERRDGAVKGAIYLNPPTRKDACSHAAHIPCYGLPVTASGSICDEYAQKIMIGSTFGAAETKARTSRE